MSRSILRIVAVATALAPVPALADCYDVFGCTDRNVFAYRDLVSGPNCEFLFQMRNGIYHQHGYCFKTPRAIATFGNQGCRYTDEDALPMNRIERTNAVTIKRAEAALGCR